MKITIAYVTGRLTPHFDWYCDSLCAQTTPEQRAELDILFIDGRCWSKELMADYQEHPEQYATIALEDTAFHDIKRREEVERAVNGRFSFRHVPPKPSAFQGPFRQTARDFFAAGLSRNTAILLAKAPYLVYADDLAVLGSQWFDQVRHAAANDYCVCGMYRKLKKMVVESGKLVSFEEFPPGVDSRWSHGSPNGAVPWHGSGMYGCSFGVPLEAMLEVDGNDVAAITQGGEDYDLGIRLERAGWAFFLNQNMFTAESEEDHYADTPLPRIRREVSADRLPPGYTGETWSDHVMLNRVHRETDRFLPLIGDGLRAARDCYLQTGLVSVPREPLLDWRDGTPLSQL